MNEENEYKKSVIVDTFNELRDKDKDKNKNENNDNEFLKKLSKSILDSYQATGCNVFYTED